MEATTTKSIKGSANRLDRLNSLLDAGKDILDEEKHQRKPTGNRATVTRVDNLIPYKDNPFHRYSEDRLDDMAESIKRNGILIPILVRQLNNTYEILSGHNRVEAAKRIGLSAVPINILTNISDEEALIYVIETNLMQRSFADMFHSEKAAVISMHHSKMFSQGKRDKIQYELNKLQNVTSVAIPQKLHSRDALAAEYSLSPHNIAQYLRVNTLITKLKDRLDKGEYALSAAVKLSYLTESQQAQVDKALTFDYKLDGLKADLLRQYHKKGRLNTNTIYKILAGELGKKKPNRTPTVKVRKHIFSQYFNQGQTVEEIQDIVEAAIVQYFSD